MVAETGSIPQPHEEAMNMRHILLAVGLCFATATPSVSTALTAELPAWEISSFYPGNPLKRATLEGTVIFDGARGRAWLVFACRADAGAPTVALWIDKATAERFPVDDFEGSGGLGENVRLVRVRVDNSGVSRAFFSSGSRQEKGVFEWSFGPGRDQPARWLKAAGKTLRVQVRNPARTPGVLEAVFILPTQDQLLREVVMPCLSR